MSADLKKTIALTYAYYMRGQALPDAVLNAYFEDLNDLDPETCVDAYTRFRKNPANRAFPLPAQIRELVNPEQFVSVEARARETAARICAAVPKFGWNNSKDAEKFIGPEGWEVVKRQGGWSYLCESMGTKINPTSFQAQLRDQLDGVFRFGTYAIEKAIQAPADRRSGDLVPAGLGIRALLPDKPDPDGAA